jgi:hypothetical protein
MTHFHFVAAAWAVCIAVLGAVTLSTVMAWRKARRG